MIKRSYVTEHTEGALSTVGIVQVISRGYEYEDRSTGQTEGPRVRMVKYRTVEGVTSTTGRLRGTWKGKE